MDRRGFFALLCNVWKTVARQLKATFRYRVAGGADNVNLPGSNGRAVFKKIYGSTVKWNQLIQNGDFNSSAGWSVTGASLQISNNEAIITAIATTSTSARLECSFTAIEDNVYYAQCQCFANEDSTCNITFQGTGRRIAYADITKNVWNKVSGIRKADSNDAASNKFRIYGFNSTLAAEGNYYKIRNVNLHNLTQRFGTDAEIAAALGISVEDITTSVGVAAFEAWLALNGGAQDYYPPDEGSLISFKGQGVRTIKNNVELDRMTLDVAKVYGKVNGQGNYVQCYPNGMLSAGSVQDTLTASEAVVKIDIIDMGDVTWGYTSDNRFSSIGLFNVRNVARLVPAVSSKYPTLYKGEAYPASSETVAYFGAKRLWLCDPTLNGSSLDSNNRIPALSGVMLYYESATPITYTDLIYSEDGGVTGTPLSEFKYKVDKYSTEELLVPASVAGEPTSTAMVADIEYQKK